VQGAHAHTHTQIRNNEMRARALTENVNNAQ